MVLNSNDDRALLINLEVVVNHGIENDKEDKEESDDGHAVNEESSELPIVELTDKIC